MKKISVPPAATVDEYLERCPDPVRKALARLRNVIRKAAPMAEEVISYQIPSYKHHGALVHFAAFEKHCSFFVVSKEILELFGDDLNDFRSSGTTIHFSPEKPLPDQLVKDIVRTRIEQNESLAQNKELFSARPSTDRKKGTRKKSSTERK